MSNSTSSSLPAPRRVITGHNSQGRSIVIRDEQVKPLAPGNITRHDIHATNETPAKVDSELDNNGKWKDETETMTSVFNLESSFSIMDFNAQAQAGKFSLLALPLPWVQLELIHFSYITSQDFIDRSRWTTLSWWRGASNSFSMMAWKSVFQKETL